MSKDATRKFLSALTDKVAQHHKLANDRTLPDVKRAFYKAEVARLSDLIRNSVSGGAK